MSGDKSGEGRRVTLEVLRYRPEQDAHPYIQSYDIPYTEGMSVLQALQYLKDYVDGTLSYRWSCRMAICGSCGMMIDGVPQLACQTILRADDVALRIEPLKHFPIERDLVVAMSGFISKLESIFPFIIPKNPRTPAEGEYLQTPAQLARFENFSDCINCMLCYAACPQFGENPDFLGPGAFALLQRYNGDSRDAGQERRLELVNSENGAWSCTAVGYCSEVCPKHVDPANAVNQNKTNSALDFFLRFLPSRSAGGK
jgi:succinate dehydrogenase iron-sulfur subunit